MAENFMGDLAAMGFDHESIMKALEIAEGNHDFALELLMDGGLATEPASGLEALEGLGFTPSQVQVALRETADVQDAASWPLDNRPPKDEPDVEHAVPEATAASKAVIICGTCSNEIADLAHVSFVQHKSVGRGLVVDLGNLRSLTRLPHKDSENPKKQFKRGQLCCCSCSSDVGNVQNNVGVRPWKNCDAGLLKFKAIKCKLPGQRDLIELRTGSLAQTLGAAVLTRLTTDMLLGRKVATAGGKACGKAASSSSSVPTIAQESGDPVEPGTGLHWAPEVPCSACGRLGVLFSKRQLKFDAAQRICVDCTQSSSPTDPPPSSTGKACGKGDKGNGKRSSTEDWSKDGKASGKGGKKNQGGVGQDGYPHSNTQGKGRGTVPSSGGKGGKQGVPQTAIARLGRVTKILANKEAGFIAPKGGGDELYFQFSRVVRAGGLPLQHGDNVEVESVLFAERPRANRVCAILLQTRQVPDLERFIHGIDFQETSLLSLISSPPFWVLLSKTPEILWLSGRLLVQVCEACDCGHLRTALPKLLDAAMGLLVQLNDRQQLFSLLRFVAAARPECLARLLPRLRKVARADEESLALTLDLLSSAALAVAGGDIENLSWQQLPLLPSPKELSGPLERPSGLPTARRSGGYDCTDDLMDTIFTLEREDCFFPLRKRINELLRGAVNEKDLHVYSVQLSGVVVSDDSRLGGSLAALRVQIRSRRSKQKLMFGSLLCLSLDSRFEKTVFATVVLRQADQILVELCSGGNAEGLAAIQAAGSMMAVESPVYYRAHLPVMRRLQRMTSVPLESELVRCQSPPDPRPQHFQASETSSRAFSVLGLPAQHSDTCPDDFLTACKDAVHFNEPLVFAGRTLDPTQAEAIAHAMGHRVALIQGPPGTGKTLIGLALVELLLSLGLTRILIVTYKGRILNEMLGMLLTHGVVRVGGGSTDNEALDSRNLGVLARAVQKSHEQMSMSKDVDKKMQLAIADMEVCARKLSNALVFTVDTVSTFGSPGQVKSFLQCPSFSDIEVAKHKDFVSSIPHDMDIAAFLAQHYADTEDSKHLPDLQRKLKEMLEKSIDEWFPSAEFKALKASISGISVLGHLPTSSSQSSPRAEESAGEEEQEEAERMQCEGRDKRDKELLSRMISFEGRRSGRHGDHAVLAQLTPVDSVALLSHSEVWELDGQQRALLVYAMLGHQQQDLQEEFDRRQNALTNILQERACLDESAKLTVLSNSRIVGLTLDGQGINAELVERWQPQVVIGEESAECPFAKMLACMHKSVTHFIQIGDPKQLPPQINSHHLVRHNFAVSMMQWLMTGLPYVSLGRQGRMLPEIRLLLSDIYPDLADNSAVVSELIPLDCIQKSVFWWTHQHEHQSEGTSFINRGEAAMAAQVVRYLLVQGVDAEKVTVLASYIAQVRLLRKLLQDLPDFIAGEVVVQTIDKYQGSENDFVIVSLVRTGELRGFLANDQGKQRRCVAQSRARKGLFFVGDHRSFSQSRQWSFLTSSLQEKDALGPGLPLVCPRHPEFRRWAETKEQIPIKEALCGQCCGLPMQCGISGHVCPRPCHGGQDLHSAERCRHVVTYQCPEGHTLKRRCCEEERSCNEPVTFNCPHDPDHVLWRKCSQAEADVQCTTLVDHPCDYGHPRTVECWQRSGSGMLPACEVQCSRTLSCGHPCPRKCGEECLPASKCQPCLQRRRAEERRAKEAALREYEAEMDRLRRELRDFESRPIQDVAVRTELFQQGPTAAEYWEVHDKVMKYIVPQHNWCPNVTCVFRVHNPGQRMKFCEVATSMLDPTHKVLKFHGCSREAAESIMNDGFRLPDHLDNMYGKGVYFASDSSKSARELYTKGSNMLLVCEVLLGKCWTVDSGGGSMKKLDKALVRRKGFDSLFAPRGTRQSGGVENDEYVVYDPRQAIVKYVVHYEKVELRLALVGLPGSSRSMVRHELKPSRAFDPLNELDLHFRVVESQFLRLCARQNITGKLSKVEYIINKPLVDRFDRRQRELERRRKGEVILAFHATRERANIENIITNNFAVDRVGSATDAGWYGRGFYFSEFPEVSLGYGMNLLLCRLLPGNTFDLGVNDRRDGQRITPGYDSHRVSKDTRGYGQELVIADPDQILPCYVLHMGTA